MQAAQGFTTSYYLVKLHQNICSFVSQEPFVIKFFYQNLKKTTNNVILTSSLTSWELLKGLVIQKGIQCWNVEPNRKVDLRSRSRMIFEAWNKMHAWSSSQLVAHWDKNKSWRTIESKTVIFAHLCKMTSSTSIGLLCQWVLCNAD